MRFTFNSEEYSISFNRKHKQLSSHFTGTSTKPYTTVEIRKKLSDGKYELFRTATVGCWHRDPYSPEKGRVRALRNLSPSVSKEFRRVMWKAYTERRTNVRAN